MQDSSQASPSILDPQAANITPSTRPSFMTSEEPLPGTQTTSNSIADTSPISPLSASADLSAKVGQPTEAAPGDQIPTNDTSFSVTPSGGNGNAKKIAAILGIIMIIGATGVGVFLAGRQQLRPAAAWDCSKYNFAVSRDGLVTAINGSTRNEPIQQANVKINDAQVAKFDVPALSPGQSANLGNVDIPTGGTFSWEVTGTGDCSDSGSYQGQASISCNAVKAFDKNWNALTGAGLASLKAGDIVRFTAVGTATSGTLDKARFTINGTARAEVTNKRPGTDEFYDEYTIPVNITAFNVTAQVHHQQSDSWY
jgi:hypothetical protein